jgi:hypothetical protein
LKDEGELKSGGSELQLVAKMKKSASRFYLDAKHENKVFAEILSVLMESGENGSEGKAVKLMSSDKVKINFEDVI